MEKPRILYHYCSNPALHSVITHRRICLSLLSMSNDSKEGKHVLDVANHILPGDFVNKNDALEQLKQIISVMSAIGFCLSVHGDMLSQWRGYADNAQGTAIGFDFDELGAATDQERSDQIIVRLGPIAYKNSILTTVMEPDLKPIIEHYRSGKMMPPRIETILSPMTQEEREEEKERFKKSVSELFYMLMRIANYAYMVKAPFFEEEEEWRVFAMVSNINGKLAFPDCQFQPSAEQLKPFRYFPINGFSPSMVREVILGPRNQTPKEVVELFLSSHGFDHVTVHRSIGSYR